VRLAVLDALRNGRPRTVRRTDDARAHLDTLRLAQTTRSQVLVARLWDQARDAPTLLARRHTHLPHLSGQARQWALDAVAMPAYRTHRDFPVVRLLVCDDAPLSHMVRDDRALGWLHTGRHPKQRSPWGGPAAGVGARPAALLGFFRSRAAVVSRASRHGDEGTRDLGL